MKKTQILLIAGLVLLLAGAILSLLGMEPYSDYVLMGGCVVIIFRGALRSREKIGERNTEKNE